MDDSRIVALLKAAGHRVQVREARADAADLALVLMQIVEPVVSGMEQGLERCETRLDALFADGEELLLGSFSTAQAGRPGRIPMG